MKCTIPEISWHNREPVLSVDIHPVSNEFYRLATGGGDCHVLIWQLNLCDNGTVKIEALSDLTRHQKAVNAVRWSPTGQYLATADDDANIIIWQLKTDNIPSLDGEANDKEVWNVYKILRGHREDIYDICWSMDGTKLLSGSIDNTAILWDLAKGKVEHIMADHKGFVQGVTWDPKGEMFATISTDRICRVFSNTGKQIKAKIFKGKLPVSQEHFLHDKEVKFFHDDTFKSFFRRLQFSPDGSVLVVPSAHIEVEDCKKILNATLIFTLDNWNRPAAILPLPKQCSTVVRCCPVLFELHEDGPEPLVKLPYRMIIAVGTDHDVILYDTQQTSPFARFQDIHYTRLTDLTWSPDGLLLTASSTDGFCSLIIFDQEELGVPYTKEICDTEETVLDVSGEELNKETTECNQEKTVNETKPKQTSFLKLWAQGSSQNKNTTKTKNISSDVIEIDDDNEIEDSVTEISNVLSEPEKENFKKYLVVKLNKDENIDLINKARKEMTDKKKKPISFIERWAKASPNKSNSVNKNPKLTTPNKDSSKTQQKINILIPRRQNATKIASPSKSQNNICKTATPVQNELKSDNKPINILIPRRKNHIPDVKSDNPDPKLKENTTKVDKPINILIPRRKNVVKDENSSIVINGNNETVKNEMESCEPSKRLKLDIESTENSTESCENLDTNNISEQSRQISTTQEDTNSAENRVTPIKMDEDT